MSSSATGTFHILGTIICLLSPSSGNGGAFSLAEYRTRPGAGAPPNRHPGDDESFYVLSGQYEFAVDGVARVVGPGGFVKVPNGSVHRFTNVGSEDATMLVINAPGAIHDRFFAMAGEPLPSGATAFPAPKGPPDVAAIRAIAERCGIEFVNSD
jgi:mannose-6-phosphate isomerase-like protein (cupin superfamily)